jgi:hypothetical protein
MPRRDHKNKKNNGPRDTVGANPRYRSVLRRQLRLRSTRRRDEVEFSIFLSSDRVIFRRRIPGGIFLSVRSRSVAILRGALDASADCDLEPRIVLSANPPHAPTPRPAASCCFFWMAHLASSPCCAERSCVAGSVFSRTIKCEAGAPLGGFPR